MSNNFYQISKIPSMPEKVISALAYLSMGTIGIIFIIISTIFKLPLKSFVKFNIYQSILLGFIFFAIQTTYNLVSSILELLNFIPFLGTFINSFMQFIVYYLIQHKIIFNFSLLASLILLLILYLVINVFTNKTPYIPFVSNAIKRIV